MTLSGDILVAIGTTIVSVAVPKISTEFHALSDVGRYGSAYLITIIALQPAGATLYKLFNIKLVYFRLHIDLRRYAAVVLTYLPAFTSDRTLWMSIPHRISYQVFHSWLSFVCCCSKLCNFYPWESHSWHRSCRTHPRSNHRHHIHVDTGKVPSLHWPRGQLFWDMCLL